MPVLLQRRRLRPLLREPEQMVLRGTILVPRRSAPMLAPIAGPRHHVRDDLGAPLGWDLAFIALGLVLVAGGLALGAWRSAETG